MLEEYIALSQNFFRIYNREYKRYFLKAHDLSNRFSIIVGQRGVGKTTAIIQYMLDAYHGDIFTGKALYVQADHFLVARRSLYEIAEEFFNLGGELICFDEIHKYQAWSGELKSINDTFPKLKIIASGSSALEIYRGSHDLSRRAIVYSMRGMSFREFIEFTSAVTMEHVSFEDIIAHHQKAAHNVVRKLEKANKKILSLFKEYLRYGYYPYFKEYKSKNLFYLTLEQNIHTTLESDLIAIFPALTGSSLKKIRKLLSIIASSVPFTPDLKNLKTVLDIGDERTLKTYLKYMEDAGVILTVSKKTKGLKELEKPGKIYLNNPNLIYAIASRDEQNIGTIRETFFFNMLNGTHKLTLPARGDFLVNGKYTIEIGGKNKDFSQIKGIGDSFLAVDDIEIGVGNKIPLWLFGFLY